jgi:hypothetical protein
LSCLDDDDYAAIPLSLQSNAVAIDAALTADQASFNAYNNSPWIQIISTTVSSAYASLNVDYTLGGQVPGFSAFSGATVNTAFGLSPASLNNVYPAGWWHVGGQATFQATGAVNTFTRRTLGVQLRHVERGISFYDVAIGTCYESNTGGDGISVSGLFFMDGVHTYFPDLIFAHRNTSSTMTVNAGARMWLTYLGSGVTI